jgi:adenosylhomocysteine nucleosidase
VTACLLFALGRESLFFRRAHLVQRLNGAPCRAWLAGPTEASALVLETGVGRPAVETALGWALDRADRPEFVLSAGFSGALCPRLRVGDLILADGVGEPGHRWPTTWPKEVPAALERGWLLTSPVLVGEPSEKARLAREHDAVAVDMETAGIARLCHQHGVPFGCLRVISDDAGTALSPHLADLLSRGRVSPFRLASALVRRPALAGELWRLARHTRLAARRLADGLASLLGWP